MSGSDYEGPVEEHRRRGRSRRCSWCGDYIKPGDLYVAWFSVYQGEGRQIRMHPECRTGGFDEVEWSRYDYEYQLGGMDRGNPWSKDDAAAMT